MKNGAKVFKYVSLSILIILFLSFVAYFIFLNVKYYRIVDGEELKIDNNQEMILTAGKEYTALTYNVGFGAYSPEYTFFMDTGRMLNGDRTRGESSRGNSKKEVKENIEGVIDVIEREEADFVLLQEVDRDSTRSYHINQADMFTDKFPEYSSVFAENFHAPYLFYPILEPHGEVDSGMLTLSKYQGIEAERHSYPITEEIPGKFFDLDRCLGEIRYPVSNGKELVLFNNHMSAYDEGGIYRTQQLELLNELMKKEVDKGNYVIVGGDFNHDFGASVKHFPSEQEYPSWIVTLAQTDLIEGMTMLFAENEFEVATCRNADIPYEKGVSSLANVDGFFVSNNIKATTVNIDEGFEYSDHNPVRLTFTLLEDVAE